MGFQAIPSALEQPFVLTAERRRWVEERARAAGFDLAGVAAVPDADSPEALENGRRFAAWVAAGHAGEMNWLKREDAAGQFLRANLLYAMPWARSVLVCAVNYNAPAPCSIEPAPPGAGWIARYAWSGDAPVDGAPGRGSDYHDVLLAQLRQVEADLRTGFPEDTQTRCYVDTGPILERDYAARAGIGWIGRNTCVLNQAEGSWLLLGVIVTSLPLAAEAVGLRATDRCGTCTRCVDACPTGALLAAPGSDNRQMDASRCIAYLTIEKKGSIDEGLREPMGRQVFGCDICQDVCPWNRRAPVSRDAVLRPRAELVNPALDWLAQMDGTTFKRWFRGSPLERTGRKRVLRNVAIAMGNSGHPAFLPQLRLWAEGDDPVLAEVARWAAERLGESPQVASLKT